MTFFLMDIEWSREDHCRISLFCRKSHFYKNPSMTFAELFFFFGFQNRQSEKIPKNFSVRIRRILFLRSLKVEVRVRKSLKVSLFRNYTTFIIFLPHFSDEDEILFASFPSWIFDWHLCHRSLFLGWEKIFDPFGRILPHKLNAISYLFSHGRGCFISLLLTWKSPKIIAFLLKGEWESQGKGA